MNEEPEPLLPPRDALSTLGTPRHCCSSFGAPQGGAAQVPQVQLWSFLTQKCRVEPLAWLQPAIEGLQHFGTSKPLEAGPHVFVIPLQGANLHNPAQREEARTGEQPLTPKKKCISPKTQRAFIKKGAEFGQVLWSLTPKAHLVPQPRSEQTSEEWCSRELIWGQEFFNIFIGDMDSGIECSLSLLTHQALCVVLSHAGGKECHPETP